MRSSWPLSAAAMMVAVALVSAEDADRTTDEPGGPSGSRAQLLVRPDGLHLEVAGARPRRFRTCAELAAALPDAHGEFRVAGARQALGSPAGARATGPSASDQAPRPAERSGAGRPSGDGEAVDGERLLPERPDGVPIEAGEIPVLEFVRALSTVTGLPVVHDSSDRILHGTILVPAPIPAATPPVIQKLLESAGLRIDDDRLEGGRRVLLLESTAGPVVPTEPEDHPVVAIAAGDLESAAGEAGGRHRKARGPEVPSARFGGCLLTSVPPEVQAHVDVGAGRGLFVAEVDETHAAEVAETSSLKLYDIVTHIDDEAIRTPKDIEVTLGALQAGAPFHYRVIRKGWTRIIAAHKSR